MKCQPLAIRGVVCAVPQAQQGLQDLARWMDAAEAEKIAKATGIRQRRIAPEGQTVADLAVLACQELMQGLGWQPQDIGLVLFVTQTPDYQLPSNAHVMHRALGLASDCICLETALGCSGYVHGLWQAGQLMAGLPRKRALLIVGDTTSTTFEPQDRSVAPLFGDAAAATALEWDESLPAPHAVLGNDGTGAPYLIQKQGGARSPGSMRSLFMDGTQVFAFTLREVPRNVRATLAEAGWGIDEVDHVVLHQANAMLMTQLARKMEIPMAKLPLALEQFGNTSSASIPLCMTETLAAELTQRPLKLLLSGFGVGWSWGSVALQTRPLAVCKTIEAASDFHGARIPGLTSS